MKAQWFLMFILIFALITAVFAVINVEPVQVNFFVHASGYPSHIGDYRLHFSRRTDCPFYRIHETVQAAADHQAIGEAARRIRERTSPGGMEGLIFIPGGS